MTKEKKVDPQEEAKSFDEVFNEADDSQESEPETKTESEEPQKEEAPKDEEESQEPESKEESPEKGDDSQESTDEPPASKKEEETWTKKAVIDERRKRQDLEKTVAELDKKLLELQAQKVQQEKAKRPDPIEDPEGANNFDRQESKQELWEMKVSLSQDFMRDKHEDYDEMEKKFQELAANNVYLSQQLRLSANPARFAYQTVKAHIESQNFKDPSYVKNLKEEMKKEILTELAGNQKTNSGDKSNVKLPTNLTNMTSVASNLNPKIDYKGDLAEVFSEES